MSPKITLTTAKATKPTALLIHRWHERLGHLYEEAIKKLKSLANGMEIALDNLDIPVYQLCLQGKQH